MAKLVVTKHGSTFAVLELQEGQEYTIGRSQNSSLVLENVTGISRNHLKFHFDGQFWVASLNSKFGKLLVAGAPAEQVQLQDQDHFSIPPYDFQLVLQEIKPVTEPERDPQSKDLVPKGSQTVEVELADGGNLETTDPGVQELQPFIKITMNPDEPAQVLRLEGRLWCAGREDSCEIQIAQETVSRKHFEIIKTSGGYSITDLKSVNGTYLNGKKIKPQKPYPLSSGDIIGIKEIKIQFELHDDKFDKKLKLVDAAALQPFNPDPQFGLMPMPFPIMPQYPVPMGPQPVERISGPDPGLQRTKYIRLGIFAGLIIVVLALLFSPEKDTGKKDSSSKEDSLAFTNLTPENQMLVKRSYEMARKHYDTKNFELCVAEIEKIEKIIKFYTDPQGGNSDSLKKNCENGRIAELDKGERERLEQERVITERRVATLLAECYLKINSFNSVDELNLCAQEVLELQPDNEKLLEYQEFIRQKELNRLAQEQRRASEQAQIARCESKFKSARSIKGAGDLRRAKEAYNEFLNCSFPDPRQLKPVAQRELASVAKELNQMVERGVAECNKLLTETNFKGAYFRCSELIKQDPQNQELKRLRDRAEAELKANMSALYKDSVFEEQLGNIDGAKQKWRLIIQDDIPGGEYHQKAKRKLEKYGDVL